VPAEIKSPDLNVILQHLEEVQHQDPAQSRPYEVTREYKVFRGYDKQPTSEVMAQINFAPPDMKTYKITQARGSSRAEKIVRQLLDRETESAKKRRGSEISRTNYDFVFLRQEDLGVAPEYVLRIVPKRKDKYLLRGQIWVDASTFRIRRIEGVPAKSPSFWIKDIHITLQYAELNSMWITGFLRRYRYGTPLRTIHTGWPQYSRHQPAIYRAEIVTHENFGVVRTRKVLVCQRFHLLIFDQATGL
jgi:hypothetical protein